jgi:hypothetical protein
MFAVVGQVLEGFWGSARLFQNFSEPRTFFRYGAKL